MEGGSDDRQAFGDVHVLDTACHPWAWSEPCTTGIHPAPRSGHTAVRVSSRHILVAGGWNPHSDKPAPLADAFLLDVDNWHWTPISDTLMPKGIQPLLEAAEDATRVGGSKRAADSVLAVPAPAPKRRGTRALATAAVQHQIADVDFGVWALAGRVGASATLLGDVTSFEAGECAVLLHGGRNAGGEPTSDTFVLPLPIPALQQRKIDAQEEKASDL